MSQDILWLYELYHYSQELQIMIMLGIFRRRPRKPRQPKEPAGPQKK